MRGGVSAGRGHPARRRVAQVVEPEVRDLRLLPRRLETDLNVHFGVKAKEKFIDNYFGQG